MGFKDFLKQDRKLFCDMDGVMVNFDKVLVEHYPKEMATKNDNTHIPLNEEDWSKFNQDPLFWHTLEPMYDSRQLWEYIRPHNPSMLTAWSGDREAAYRGKWFWCNVHLNLFDEGRFHCVQREDKLKYAVTTPGVSNILIDDYRKNIEEWNSVGGIGILHVSAERTINELKQLGY
jgi:hypothetical protein